MRMAYKSADRFPEQGEVSLRNQGLRNLVSLLSVILTLVGIGAVPYMVSKDLGRLQTKNGLPRITRQQAMKASEQVFASMEEVVAHAGAAALTAGRWANLAWKNLSAFEESIELLKTPPDPRNPVWVEHRRRQGAQQIVILLDHHNLLGPIMRHRSHEETASRIGGMFNIEPARANPVFRQAQQEQIDALRQALDRHFGDLPAPSDLSQFTGEASPSLLSLLR